jgi:hypothetical protein
MNEIVNLFPNCIVSSKKNYSRMILLNSEKQCIYKMYMYRGRLLAVVAAAVVAAVVVAAAAAAAFFHIFNIFHISTYISTIFSISFHYSTYFSSIFSISFHYSTCLSSIFSISFHYSTYFSFIFSKLFTIQLTFLP